MVRAKQRILAFTSLFPFHLTIIYIIFAHTSLDLMVLQVRKICVLDLPCCASSLQQKCMHVYFKKIQNNTERRTEGIKAEQGTPNAAARLHGRQHLVTNGAGPHFHLAMLCSFLSWCKVCKNLK